MIVNDELKRKRTAPCCLPSGYLETHEEPPSG